MGNNNVGGLVGLNVGGTITNSYATGSVAGSGIRVGGLVGFNNGGTITNSYATSAVTGSSISSNDIGGLIGFNNGGTITDSYATGDVAGSGFSVGGLAGANFSGGTITNSYATGFVEGSGIHVGGLVGWNRGTITNSYATGTVSGFDNTVGGLVGVNLSDGTITNSYATGTASGNNNVGGLVGLNEGGTITNNHATGSVSGRDDVGGLVGLNGGGTITNSHATGSVAGSGADVGGLVGENLSGGTIADSHAMGFVVGLGNNVSGLVGLNNGGTITNSYATGFVEGSGNSVGGLVGRNEGGTITNSYATGSVAGSDASVGGLVGWNVSGTITNSYATGDVTGSRSRNDIGGLVGFNRGTITNSYATGSVEGSGNTVGGLVGRNDGIITNSYATGDAEVSRNVAGGLVGENRGGTITNSYATGTVSGNDNVGGLVGRNNVDNGIVDSYWDTDTSGITMGAYGTGKTTMALQSQKAGIGIYISWSSDDWDFGTSSQYPVLKYNSDCREADDDTSTDSPICGSLLSPTLRGLSQLQLVQGNLSPDFDVAASSYRGVAVNSTSTVQFRPITVNRDAKVYITVDGQTRGLAINSGDESSMISLNPNGITTITVEVENGGETMQTIIYTLYLNYYEFDGDVDRDDDGLIEIDDLEGLNAIRHQPDGTGYRESETAPKIATGCPNNRCRGYELTRNLDFNDGNSYSSTANRIIWTTGAGWQPIGDSSDPFTGKFEGNGFTISNLKINRPDTNYRGLFHFVRREAEIANVGLLDVDIIGGNYVGGLVGFNSGGTITNSYATGSVAGFIRVGGLVGFNSGGTITNSYATGSVSGSGNNVGGLVGENRGGTITNSYATGTVLRSSNSAGGLVGENSGTITNSYATGDVTGSRNDIGGLVGFNRGTITNSYATGTVEGLHDTVGGLVGRNDGIITNSYATGDAKVSRNGAGGLVGLNNGGTITNSYATGDVTGSANNVGGLVGFNGGTITNGYATGSVRGTSRVGGLVGWMNNGSTTNGYATGFVSGSSRVGGLVGQYSGGAIENSYWDWETSNEFSGFGGSLRSTEQLQSPDFNLTYRGWSDDDWDFGTSSQYPVLKYTDDPRTSSKECLSMNDTSADLPICGSLLSPTLRYGLSELQLVAGELSPDFNVVVPNYRGTAINSTSTVQFRPITVNSDAKVYITADEQTRGQAIDSGNESSMISLNTNGITTITVEVENDGETAQTVIYTLYLHYEYRDVDRDDDGLIEIDDLETLNAIGIQLDGSQLQLSGEAPTSIGCASGGCNGYELTRDLDFDDDASYSSTANKIMWTTGVGWSPIGYSSSAFTGKFEGNGFTISNLKIDRPSDDPGNDYIGLFGSVGQAAEITNVGLLDVNIIGNENVGGLVGWNNGGTITNSYATGSVAGSGNSVGGLVGDNRGTITNSYATSAVRGTFYVGGLVGFNSGTITNSYATGSVAGSGNSVGGLVGFDSGTITNSYATGAVSGAAYVGGLVGWNQGTIMNSYATGSVSGADGIGGLVGLNLSIITNSYAIGSVSGSSNNIGGLVGDNRGTITNSYATGSVSGAGGIGGLVGLNLSIITNSYAIGSVSGSSNNIGGLVGDNRGTITNSYWDRNTSGRPTSAGGMRKTTAELQSPVMPGSSSGDTYHGWTTDNWDFGTSSQYPVLKYANDTNMDISECRIAGDTSTDLDLPLCGSLLSPTMRGLSELQLVAGELSPDFDVAVPNYRGTVANSTSTIRFRPITINTNTKVYITAEGQPRGLAIDSGDESSMIALNTNGITTITVEVENGGETTQTVTYTLDLYYEFSRGLDRDDVDKDDDGLIEIDDLETLNAIRNQLDGSHLQLSGLVPTSMGCARGGCKGYELTRDLDFNEDDSYSSPANQIIWTMEAGWQPIGDSSSNAFASKFEGNGFTISNLKINRSGTNNVGLFGFVGQAAEITNVGLLDVDIMGNNNVGGLVGLNGGGTITNSYAATGSVSGSRIRVGGLVGRNDGGTITNSYATSAVTGSSISSNDIGGLVGFNNGGTITNSYATGDVAGSGFSVGGLAGANSSGGTITNSYATGFVEGSGNHYVGGLVGWNRGTITNSYATGTVVGSLNDVGGLVGWSDGTITNSYATGTVSGSGSSSINIGGLVGRVGEFVSGGTITNSYATGFVRGSSRVGGLVGRSNGTITNSYATGAVVGSGDDVGGLVGRHDGGTIENSYWDTDTSGRPTSDGDAVGKTTVELQSPDMPGSSSGDTYHGWTTDNWDFGTSSQYPVLKYNSNCRSMDDNSADLPLCGSLLSPTMRGLSELQLVAGELSPDFDVAVPNYRGTVANSTSTIRFRPITINTNTKVYITAEGQTRGLAINSGDESSMISLNTDGITTITVEVENGGETTQTVIYTLDLYYEFGRGLDRDDVDRDDDGLIEIDDLETLNAIRNQLDGSHLQLSGLVPTSMGCARGGCNGYELTRDLDFDDDDSYSSPANQIMWTTDSGWQPIGDASNAFTSKFEGNGFTISNLKIDRPGDDPKNNYVGLFGSVSQEAEITNVGLLNVDIMGNISVGGLVGENRGTIMNSYVTGSVSGSSGVGGLVGENRGTIMNSYVTSIVTGFGDDVGGLVGLSSSGTIMNSYAIGSVSGSGDNVGGLVGNNAGTITNSYAASAVGRSDNSINVGGLVGLDSSNNINNSYWDSDTSGLGTSAGGTSKTTVALQSSTTASRVYNSWNDDNWDFGTTEQYPVIKYTPGDDSSSPACDSETSTPLPSCDSILPGQRELPSAENTAPTITIAPSIPQTLPVSSTAHIVVSVVDDDFRSDDIVTLSAMSSSQTIVSVTPVQIADIRANMITTFMLNAKQGGEATITFTAIDMGELRDSVELLVRVNITPMISGIPQQPIRILEGLSTELDVAISDANVDDSLDVRIETSDSMIATATIIATSGTTRTLKISGVSAGDAMITVMVDDGTDVANSSASAVFEVQVIENTTPTIMITPSTDQTLSLNSTARIVVSVTDDNFNLDDIVTLSAISSSQTVVSVVPAQVTGISTDTITTFILSAEQNGETTITFTATDSGGLSASETVSMDVITVIRIHVRVFLEGLLQ